ncbi:hypothetical protein CHS0354_022930 [Potamilus streckersoni]|uniref:Transcription initiation factor TFIID subunit 12 n=1 Tax=Potamilus streckersoni TaxID=2493646 RepID=A0AAE0S574_9BIVA|nr:hypothetical protein CHS0354_022930 [Potamilus streckersoni]
MNTPPVSTNIVTLTGSTSAAGTTFITMDHQQQATQQHTVMSKLPVDNTNIGPGMTVSNPMMNIGQPQIGIRPTLPTSVPQVTAATGQPMGSSSTGDGPKVLDKRRLQELVKEVDPLEQLDDDVEEVLLQIADDFIESVVTASCQIAKHRKSSTLEARDIQLHLERAHNMWIPGFGTDDLRPYKKACTTEAHKQRMALIRKTMKKT